ncbi:2OG-Fe(II) oxygenase [Hirschia baltica]|uniref:Prolyl 4-hydroxylase alpha subunit Fe(2+) 2OG dioxygenase domain-containing protein n=1 Tax=Hirschia baltica (strain ATCC 49814 / DSM 5838 / IFAM 1418) TaxID=582402 RepID=C6XRI1_HIRBI|nr:2OG-Fe(II) oxygenase [Hirschia baltica]ACT58813.1 conserved hypothetical protein [Hirschia baltica ATCC 49814]
MINLDAIKGLFGLSEEQTKKINVFAPGAIEKLTGLAADYQSAQPFPHLVIDNLFENDVLSNVIEEWPATSESSVEPHDDGTYSVQKYASTWKTEYGPNTREILRQLNEAHFLQTLTAVTGIQGLMPDPYMLGGGLHFTSSGGKLAIHADFNKHHFFKLDRRLNLLVYLNDGWKEENQGWLELWDREMTSCQRRILPVMNRTVLFSTTDFSFHGQPEKIVGPPDLMRRSIAVYYFSNGRPQEEISGEEHSTLWRERPGQGF